ncbi:MAG: FAD-dependent oxidoreductase [Candidatus Binatia bacterium]
MLRATQRVDTHLIADIDVLAIGGGIAATMAAIQAKEDGAPRVMQVDKGMVGKTGNSCFAAGVMHVRFPEDDLNDRVRRLTRSLGFLADQQMICDHLQDSFPVLTRIRNYGTRFYLTADNTYQRMAGRGAYPVVMFYSTQLMDSLRKAALSLGVEQVHKIFITDLLTQQGEVVGAAGFHLYTGDFYVFRARVTVVATGGTYYKGIHPGHRDCSGDGFAMAYRAGAVLSGAEHNDSPCNFFPARVDVGPGMNKWMGEGGIFVNANGERFMPKYFPKLGERMGHPGLLFAFCMEARQGHVPIYMDARHLGEEAMDRLFKILPLPQREFESIGVIRNGRFVERVEFCPTAPIGRPGIFVDREFASTLPRLYACGEACSPQAVVTGLAAAATSGVRAGAAAARYAREAKDVALEQGQVADLRRQAYRFLEQPEGVESDHILLKRQEGITPYDVLLLREGSRMERALRQVELLRDQELPLLGAYDLHYLRLAHETSNLVLVAELHLKAALQRTESRQILREDYPYADNVNWLKWLKVRLENKKQIWWTDDIPMEQYPLQPGRKVELAYFWQLAKDLGIVDVSSEGKIQWVFAE